MDGGDLRLSGCQIQKVHWVVHSDDLGRGRENDQETAKRNKEVTTHLCAHRSRENGRETRVLEQEPRQAGEGNISEYVRLRRVC